MKGLPQPYNLRPRTSTRLTTPQKKMMWYILALTAVAFIIYTTMPAKEKPVEMSIDTAKKMAGAGMKRVQEADVDDAVKGVHALANS